MISLSNRTFPMLQTFANEGAGYRMGIEEAQKFDQRPFRALLVREYIRYTGRGFVLTDLGREAWQNFQATGILRKDPTLPLTAYFDPTAYGLKPRRKKARVQTMPVQFLHTA